MPFLLGSATIGFLVLLLIGKILTVLELRSQDQTYRRNQRRIAELGEALDTSRRKYLIALKAEGVAKQKLAHQKTRFANMKQHLEQIELTAVQQKAKQQQDLNHKLEVLVMKAMGGPSARRDSHFKRVMSVIMGLIDLEAEGGSEEVVAVVQKKLAEMGQTGVLQGLETGRGDAGEKEKPSGRTDRTGTPKETGAPDTVEDDDQTAGVAEVNEAPDDEATGRPVGKDISG